MLQKRLLRNNLQHGVKSLEKIADGFCVFLPIRCRYQREGEITGINSMVWLDFTGLAS